MQFTAEAHFGEKVAIQCEELAAAAAAVDHNYLSLANECIVRLETVLVRRLQQAGAGTQFAGDFKSARDSVACQNCDQGTDQRAELVVVLLGAYARLLLAIGVLMREQSVPPALSNREAFSDLLADALAFICLRGVAPVIHEYKTSAGRTGDATAELVLGRLERLVEFSAVRGTVVDD